MPEQDGNMFDTNTEHAGEPQAEMTPSVADVDANGKPTNMPQEPDSKKSEKGHERTKSFVILCALLAALATLFIVPGVVRFGIRTVTRLIETPEERKERELRESIEASFRNCRDGAECKPVIYLYPTAETEVSVDIDRPELITVSYPTYDDGWHVTADPDGTLNDVKSGRSLYSLYYEAALDEENQEDMNEGFVVVRDDLTDFLEDSLSHIGLSDREAEEFIVYWLPKMQEHEFCYVRFALTDEEQSRHAIHISPEPDHLIRIRMIWMGLDDPIEGVTEQDLPDVDRADLNGFVAVEWGGTEL